MSEEKQMPTTHLGDGVYAIWDGFGVWLYANSHINPTDKVYLEPEVFEGLKQFIEKNKSED